MIPIPLVIVLALLVIAGLCWAGHRRCVGDDLGNAQREAALTDPADDEIPAASSFTWGHSDLDEEVAR